MALKFLDGLSWAEVTREERFFCARLYQLILQHGISHFIRYLNEAHSAGLKETSYWELAYEACFYRDLHHHRGRGGTLYSPKRTFDLALLSDTEIMIIEAKAYCAFQQDQLLSFERDQAQVMKETGVERVTLAALSSSQYDLPSEVATCFDGPRLTWAALATLFGGDPILRRADAIYEASSSVAYGQHNSDGSLSGIELLACHQRGEDFWVGRGGGLHGPRLRGDITSGEWRVQHYETNRQSDSAPSRNWFRLSDFVSRIKV